MKRIHRTAAILAVGDELVLGQKNDTNSGWIAAQLADLGVVCVEHVRVGDDLSLIAGAMRRLASLADLVICTGGLGPTADDLTRDALAVVLGDSLVIDPAALADIEGKFARRGRVLPDAARTQAMRPASATILPNEFGTAPGLFASLAEADIACLPGPPRELEPMFHSGLVPKLRVGPQAVRTRVLRCVGIAEVDAAARLGSLMARDRNPLVGITASACTLTVPIRYQPPEGPPPAEDPLDQTLDEVRRLLAPYIFGSGGETLPEAVLSSARQAGRKLATAESCTGGMIAAKLTEISGSSQVFLGGWITYSNQAKSRDLGVPPALFESVGAVSREVVLAMARGALDRSGADDVLAVTGIAGPGGGSDDKPVGTVWIARASRSRFGGAVDARRFVFNGGRGEVRTRAVNTALGMLHFSLRGLEPGTPELMSQVGPAHVERL